MSLNYGLPPFDLEPEDPLLGEPDEPLLPPELGEYPEPEDREGDGVYDPLDEPRLGAGLGLTLLDGCVPREGAVLVGGW